MARWRISELQDKEVVDISDGTRYGYITDVEVDAGQGTVTAIVVAASAGCWGCWAGSRRPPSPGPPSAGWGRISSWWTRAGAPPSFRGKICAKNRKKMLAFRRRPW